jgi:O-acetylserine/cysteine efflux transporter
VTPANVLQAVLVMAIWGLNFSASKIALTQFSPFLVNMLRFALVAVTLLPFVRPPHGQWRAVLGYAFVLGGLHFPLIFTGLQGLDASTAVIAMQAQVPFAALLAAVLLGDRPGWRRTLGMTVAFAGILVIAGEPRHGVSLLPLLLVLGAAFAFAFSNIQIKWMGPMDPLTLTGYMALFAVPMLLALSLLREHDQLAQIAAADWRGWAALLYMGGLSTVAAYLVWQPLMRRFPVNQVMPFTLLIPVFGVGGGVVVMGDHVTLRFLIGGLLTVLGVAVILIRRPATIEPRPTT